MFSQSQNILLEDPDPGKQLILRKRCDHRIIEGERKDWHTFSGEKVYFVPYIEHFIGILFWILTYRQILGFYTTILSHFSPKAFPITDPLMIYLFLRRPELPRRAWVLSPGVGTRCPLSAHPSPLSSHLVLALVPPLSHRKRDLSHRARLLVRQAPVEKRQCRSQLSHSRHFCRQLRPPIVHRRRHSPPPNVCRRWHLPALNIRRRWHLPWLDGIVAGWSTAARQPATSGRSSSLFWPLIYVLK